MTSVTIPDIIAPFARIVDKLVTEFQMPVFRVSNAIRLLLEGATVPFIARYRKELTGSMDEVEIAKLHDRFTYLSELEERRALVLKTIEEQGKLTPELKAQIVAVQTKTDLEDLYAPYKPRRRTRATKARDAGLTPLADAISDNVEDPAFDPTVLAATLISEAFPDVDAVLGGARDILAEELSLDAPARQEVRGAFAQYGKLRVVKHDPTKDKDGKFADLATFSIDVARAPGHRILALNRGEREDALTVLLEGPDEGLIEWMHETYVGEERTKAAEQMRLAATDAYERLLNPSCAAEVRSEATARADAEAIEVFATNLRALLLQKPLGEHAVCGIDPGFRTGCKVAIVDKTGAFVTHTVIYPTPPANDGEKAEAVVEPLLRKHEIHMTAIGNGTGSREAERWARGLAKRLGGAEFKLDVVVVAETGASIYSASAIAREEFPDLDLTVRGAISIARRLQDPLAELVKIEPKSLGVGQYQHDVDQKALKLALDRVVENCVNLVGVDVNTASVPLLTYVSGIGPKLAQSIVDERQKIGRFKDRRALQGVKGLGPKAFEQCAGFLRIRAGDNILDNTAVHPERYDLVEKMAKKVGTTVGDLVTKPEMIDAIQAEDFVDDKAGVGLPTITDILAELRKPGRDPRGDFTPFEFAEGVEEIADLDVGMVVPGIVTNVTAFGAFVDVGVHQDGLIHVSELADKFVKDPSEVIQVGQRIRVQVMTVDIPRKRIGLSLKRVPTDQRFLD